MILRLQSLFVGLLALLTAALLALAPVSAKPTSGGYQLFEPVALEHQHAIQLAALGNFDYHAKIASECCNAPNTGLSRSQIDEVVGTAKGQRPDPSDYMSQADIDEHLARFDDGAVRFTSRTDVDNYGTAGNSEAFVMPKSEFDRVVSEAGGDLRVVEQRLGLDSGYLSSGDTMAVHIQRQDMPDLRVPSGNEGGANSQWVPGGFTSGGVPEAVVDLTNAPFTELPF